jgi:hypothetical protein
VTPPTFVPPAQLADGVWHWLARHPEWHPAGFGSLVVCYALAVPGGTLLVDPLVPDDGWDAIDALVDGRVDIAITMPYHVRSGERAAKRYATAVHGHPACAKRMAQPRLLQPLEALASVSAHPIGRPRRHETPLHVPARRAVVFGDAVVGVQGGDGPLRMWTYERLDARREAWYATTFADTLRPLVELEPEHVLPTHGPAVIGGGAGALAAALDRPVWFQ